MKPLFEEKQRYTQWWLWLIIVSAAVIVTGVFMNAVYVQLVTGNPWGDKPLSDDALIVYALFMISCMIIMLLIFFNSVLEITVDRSGVSYRYFPLIRSWRRIDRENIQAYELKKYYLQGYGIKRDLRGNKTINVKGNTGVELVMFDGIKLVLGTQKPDEFLNALKKMKNGRAD